jgi:Zn-dependent M28 family amino/carboxypeptidase
MSDAEDSATQDDESKKDKPRRFLSLRLDRKSAWRILAALGAFLIICFIGVFLMIRMPGKSHKGPLPELAAAQAALAAELRADVTRLAGEIGERNYHYYAELKAAADYIETQFRSAGLEIERQAYQDTGKTYENLIAEIAGGERASEIVVVGAHYDSVVGSPGANDNGSGVAALLALARRLADSRPTLTLRLVAFVNEEPPYFQGDAMGSRVYARRCRERGDNIVAMMSLETIGYYSDAEGSQNYPSPAIGWCYPSRGDFIAFVGNVGSRALVRRSIRAFRASAPFPSEGAALPSFVPGVGWSDQWAFWQEGYPGIMITDTAPFRYPYYHTEDDLPDKLDYERMARVVEGIEAVVRMLAEASIATNAPRRDESRG